MPAIFYLIMFYKPKNLVNCKLDVLTFALINEQIDPKYVDMVSYYEPGMEKVYSQVVDEKKVSFVMVRFYLNKLGTKSYHKEMIIWLISPEGYENFIESKEFKKLEDEI